MPATATVVELNRHWNYGIDKKIVELSADEIT